MPSRLHFISMNEWLKNEESSTSDLVMECREKEKEMKAKLCGQIVTSASEGLKSNSASCWFLHYSYPYLINVKRSVYFK